MKLNDLIETAEAGTTSTGNVVQVPMKFPKIIKREMYSRMVAKERKKKKKEKAYFVMK